MSLEIWKKKLNTIIHEKKLNQKNNKKINQQNEDKYIWKWIFIEISSQKY